MGFVTLAHKVAEAKKPYTGLRLADIAEGSLVKLNESGSPVEFYVAKHDYEPSLNGNGRTLLVRKECHSERKWNSASNSAYATSAVDAWLNGDYKSLLDASVQNAIGETSFYYTIGNTDPTQATLSRSVFLLSLAEHNRQADNVNADGSALPIASVLAVATLGGEAVDQWTRSVVKTSSKNVYKIKADGEPGYPYCTYSNGIRPCFTLPADTAVDEETLLLEEVS